MKMKMTTPGLCCTLFFLCQLFDSGNGCFYNEDFNQDTYNDGTSGCCNATNQPTFYFTKTEICCNGTVHDRNGMQCCNGKLYDPAKSICCNNTVYVRENKVCCGSELFRPDTHPVVCCGGKLYNSSQECCGGQVLYDKSSQICCEFNGSFSVAAKKTGDCCYDKAFNRDHQRCVNDQVLSFHEDLCGIEKYNIFEKKCCDQTLYNKPYVLSDCCGSQLFDVNKSKCCRGSKTVIPSNLKCCGEGSFNDSTHLCCNNVIKSKEGGSRCCGSEIIDDTEGCCGANVYSLNTQKCCNTNIIPQHQTCSGGNGYDYKTQICCKNKTIIDGPIDDCESNANASKPPRNRDFLASTTGICGTCLWNSRCIYRKIKAGNQSVCKTYTYRIRIYKAVHAGIFWTMHGKLLKGNKEAKTVRLIVPCKSKKLKKKGEFLLLTDSTIGGKTLRLGDSDLLLRNHHRMRKIISKKKQTCRKLSLFVRRFQKAKKEINAIIDKIIRPLR